MRPLTFLLVAAAVAGITGCSKQPPAPTPLSVQEWQAMPVDEKYTSEILQRLKVGDTALQTAEGWEEFSRTVVAKSRKKDFPGGKAPKNR